MLNFIVSLLPEKQYWTMEPKEPKENTRNIREVYENLMQDFNPSQYVNTTWEMQNGFYKQYSVFDENCEGISGTINSIKAL